MKFNQLLKEAGFEDIKNEQDKWAKSMMSNNKPAVSLSQLETTLIKTTLGQRYKPNEYRIGANGSSFEVVVGDKNFSGPFEKVLKSCVDFVVKG